MLHVRQQDLRQGYLVLMVYIDQEVTDKVLLQVRQIHLGVELKVTIEQTQITVTAIGADHLTQEAVFKTQVHLLDPAQAGHMEVAVAPEAVVAEVTQVDVVLVLEDK